MGTSTGCTHGVYPQGECIKSAPLVCTYTNTHQLLHCNVGDATHLGRYVKAHILHKGVDCLAISPCAPCEGHVIHRLALSTCMTTAWRCRSGSRAETSLRHAPEAGLQGEAPARQGHFCNMQLLSSGTLEITSHRSTLHACRIRSV